MSPCGLGAVRSVPTDGPGLSGFVMRVENQKEGVKMVVKAVQMPLNPGECHMPGPVGNGEGMNGRAA